MTQYGDHMKQLKSGKKVKNIGGIMVVFSDGSDRSIGHNSYFWTVPHLHRGVMMLLSY